MKKNVVFHKSEKKKLVINNQHKNHNNLVISIQKAKNLQTQNDFFTKPNDSQQQKLFYKMTSECDNFKQLPVFKKSASLNNKSFKIIEKKQQNKNQCNNTQYDKQNKFQRSQSNNLLGIKTHRTKKLTTIISQHSLHQRKSTFFAEVIEIYKKLNQQQILQGKTANSITLKKQKFYEVFISLLEYLSHNNQYLQQSKQNILTDLIQNFHNIRNKIRNQQLQRKKLKLRCKSGTCKFQITAGDLYQERKLKQNNLLQLHNSYQLLNEKLSSKKSQLNIIAQFCNKKQKETTELQKKIIESSELLGNQIIKLEDIQKQINQKQQFLTSIDHKVQQMIGFVEKQQEKKVLQWVSEAYKEIQSQIYDYACYLQCNAMASSLTWEPKPFRAVQKWVYEEMDRLSTFLMSQTVSLQEKSVKMKYFIVNTTRKFKTKDEQMMKIVDFKTECIKKFIKMMQKCLQNWQLKLKNLRSQFIVESQQINNDLNNIKGLIKGQFSSQNLMEAISLKLDSLSTLWSKVETNYYYGNSFY